MKQNPTETEAHKYLKLVKPYLKGIGIDIGSQGAPVVPNAWSFDLPQDKFLQYNGGYDPRGPIQLRGDAAGPIPIDSESLDFVFSSHLLEDFVDWHPILKEWARLVKPGGYMVILVPDRELFLAALAKGQPPNDAHRHESHPGELSTYAEECGCEVVKDELTNQFEGDYTIWAVFKKR